MKKFTFFTLAAAALFAAGCSTSNNGDEPDPKVNQLSSPVLSASDITAVSFTVTWDAVENAVAYEYALNGGDPQTTAEHSATFDDLEPATEYTVTVKAVADRNSAYADSETVQTKVSTLDDGLKYGGVLYKTVTLEDGNTWMAENLRYVPDGKAVSADPAAASGIWYPYTFDGADCVAVTDEEGVEELGLLYDAATAFGVDEITADNAASLEGTQGICPDGWHIPSFDELLNLVGKCSKISAAAVGDWEQGSIPENKDAVFYNAGYDGGKIPEINAAGFNFVFCGTRNGAGSGSYVKPVSGYDAMLMTYIWGSTVYNPAKAPIQFLSLMSTATSVYPEGRLTVAFDNNPNGCAVRCVKNK